MAALGLRGSPEAAEQASDVETAMADIDFASSLFKSASSPRQGGGPSPLLAGHSPVLPVQALQGCKAAAVLLGQASDELSSELVSSILHGFATGLWAQRRLSLRLGLIWRR